MLHSCLALLKNACRLLLPDLLRGKILPRLY